MNAALFEQLGKFGGIGGITLGVFLVIALQVIKGASRKPDAKTLKLYKLLLFFSWSLGVAGLVAWGVSSQQTNLHVESKGGVAAGRDIVDTKITTVPSSTSSSGQKPYAGSSKDESGVTAKDGVAAGREIKGTTININGPTQSK